MNAQTAQRELDTYSRLYMEKEHEQPSCSCSTNSGEITKLDEKNRNLQHQLKAAWCLFLPFACVKEDFTDDDSQTTFEGFPPSPVPSHTDGRVAAAGEEDDDCLCRLVLALALAQRSRSDWLLVPSLCLVCYQACCWALMRTYRRPKSRGREVAVWPHAPSPIYLSIVSCIVVASLSCYF